LLVTATFLANQDYIAANLCVNKDHPEMHCNGHCQLDKKLNEDQKQNQPNSSDKRISFEASVFLFNEANPIAHLIATDTITPQNGIPVIFTAQSYYAKTVHPPSFCS